jgi:hypothetical protein
VVDSATAMYEAMRQNRRNVEESEARLMQDVGKEPNQESTNQAAAFQAVASVRVIHTIALALQSIAPELDNSEPAMFLTGAECLDLAQALMNLVPAEWQGDTDGTDQRGAEESAATERTDANT